MVPLAALLGLLACSLAAAQPPRPTAPRRDELPPPENTTVETRDGMILRVTFYPSTGGKDAVPLILLHAFRGSRGDLLPMAEFLQRQGHAVLVPDLRGHGESTGWRDGGSLDVATVSQARLPGMVLRMVANDMEALKGFLMRQHNAGELNIGRLGIVGVEMGALVALDWARVDWSWPPLATGPQGQDVKCLILISPPRQFHSLTVHSALSHEAIRRRLSILFIVGEGHVRAFNDVSRMHRILERARPYLRQEMTREQRAARVDLGLARIPTSLQGIALIEEEEFRNGVFQAIGRFVGARLVKQGPVWRDRTAPVR